MYIIYIVTSKIGADMGVPVPLVRILAIRTMAKMTSPRGDSKQPRTLPSSAMAVILQLPREQLEVGYRPLLLAIIEECGRAHFRDVVTPEAVALVIEELTEPNVPITRITPTMAQLLRELSRRPTRTRTTAPAGQVALFA